MSSPEGRVDASARRTIWRYSVWRSDATQRQLDPGAFDDVLMTCELAVAEVLRAVGRVGGDLDVALAHLDSLEQLVVDRDLLLAAGRLELAGLRTLDTIHLSAATAAGEDLAGVVTYDDRMGDAASDLGLAPLAPGRTPAE